jgi:hypothetical protein
MIQLSTIRLVRNFGQHLTDLRASSSSSQTHRYRSAFSPKPSESEARFGQRATTKRGGQESPNCGYTQRRVNMLQMQTAAFLVVAAAESIYDQPRRARLWHRLMLPVEFSPQQFFTRKRRAVEVLRVASIGEIRYRCRSQAMSSIVVSVGGQCRTEARCEDVFFCL